LPYFVKHAFSELEEYNTFKIHPWYGVGQGAGDAAIQWIVLSNSLTIAYWSKYHKWVLFNPRNTVILTQGIDVFINDKTMMTASTPQNPFPTMELLYQTQENITLHQRAAHGKFFIEVKFF